MIFNNSANIISILNSLITRQFLSSDDFEERILNLRVLHRVDHIFRTLLFLFSLETLQKRIQVYFFGKVMPELQF